MIRGTMSPCHVRACPQGWGANLASADEPMGCGQPCPAQTEGTFHTAAENAILCGYILLRPGLFTSP